MDKHTKELITTGLSFDVTDFDNVIFAGDWCFFDSDNETFSGRRNTTLDYPITPEDIIYIEQEITFVCDTLLSRITVIYNELFKLNKSERYYKVVLGRWLYHFLHNVYEKKVILEYANHKYPGIIVASCGRTYDVSHDCNSYSWRTYQSHVFNFRLFSAVTEFIPQITTRKVSVDVDENQNNNETIDQRFNLINFYQQFLCLINRIFCNKLILVVSPYYPRFTLYNSLWFFFASKFKIVHYKFQGLTSLVQEPDLELRNSLADKLQLRSGDIFLDISSKLVFSFIPKSLLENFSQLQNEAKSWCVKNGNISSFFTANAIHTDERFKYIVGEADYANLWISQHGFGYGVNKVISSENYERSLANRYFTWGLGSYVLPNPKLILVKENDYKKQRRIVFTFPSLHEYSTLLETPISYSCDLPNFLLHSNILVENLDNQIQKEVCLRQQKRKGLRLLKLDYPIVDDSYVNFHTSLENSRLHLSNHFGTPFLESLAMNLPTIVIHCVALSEFLKESALEDFERLKAAKIIFTDPLEASKHINSVYHHIDLWWMNEKTQLAVKDFCYKYARADNKWKNVWLKNLLN